MANLSPIPLFGLPHKADIFRHVDADDGFGGIDSTETPVLELVRCRIASMTDKDEQEGFGNVTGRHWKVVMKYSPTIQRSDIFRMAASVVVDAFDDAWVDEFDNEILGGPEGILSPLEINLDYRIIYVKSQIDHRGRFHHTSLVIEPEDTDTDGDG